MRPIALLVCLVAAACAGPGDPASPTAASAPGTPAAVDAVLDGDSIRALVGGTPEEIRLLGINAPERGECFADRSRQVLSEATGDSVTLTIVDRDRFGRLLAYAESGGVNLNQWMLAQGAALAIATDHALLPDFLAAEQDAVERGVGLWSPDECGSPASGRVFIASVEYDAPGRDDDNLNGEVVAIGNSGAARDLGGWVLRDESSSHRYTFPAGFVLASGAFVVVRSGCGADSGDTLYWCSGGAVWNNSGDTALLLDAEGRFVSRSRYFN